LKQRSQVRVVLQQVQSNRVNCVGVVGTVKLRCAEPKTLVGMTIQQPAE
jgi:hypothetical protein